jgi:hypothetical protein
MSPELINNIATLAGVLVAALGAFIFAFWVAMGIWAFNDIRSRSRDWLAIILAVLLVMVFPIVGLILYMLIRPKSTLADAYDRALEEEALLRELEETHACAACGVPVKETWIFCPNCHTQLQHTCPACSNLVRNEWAICVYCGTAQRPAVATRAAQELGAAPPVLGREPQVLTTGYAQNSLAAPAIASVAGSPSPARRASRNPFARDAARDGTPAAAPTPTTDGDDNPFRPARASEG